VEAAFPETGDAAAGNKVLIAPFRQGPRPQNTVILAG
jgi:hypothetical protein